MCSLSLPSDECLIPSKHAVVTGMFHLPRISLNAYRGPNVQWTACPPTTPPAISRCSRGSRRSASARACTSARPTRAGSCTASGRSSTTRSTRRSAGTASDIDIVLHADGSVEVRDHARGIPVDIEPSTGLQRRRGRLHQAPRRRQVRRRLVRGIRRSARRRRLRRQRALRAARRRGRPRRQDLGDVVPPRRARRLRRHGRADAGCAVHPVRPRQRAAGRRQGRQGRHRHPHPLLGRPSDLHEGRRLPARGARPTGCGRPRSWCPGSSSTSPTSAATSPGARRSASTAASPSSSSTSPPTRRSPTPGG